jgi:hypothetical protein
MKIFLIRRTKMNREKVMTFVGLGTTAIFIAIGFQFTLTNAQTGHEQHMQMNMMEMSQNAGEQAKTEKNSLEKVHSEHLPMILQHIEMAIKAIEAGKTSNALAELQSSKLMLASVDKIISQHITPVFVNNKCPIMGTTINPTDVTEDLIREYKGQKVAFCCKMCPAEWDKLSDAEKEAKLAEVKINTQVQSENKI